MQETVDKDTAGRGGYYGIFSENLVSNKNNDISIQFSYGISDFDLDTINKIENNGGTISITDTNLLTATSGTNIAGEASIETKDSIRYRAGSTCVVQFTAQFENQHNADSEVWIGPFNGANGFRIGYEDGDFKFQTLKNSVVTKSVKAEDFNNGYPAFKQYDYNIDNINESALNIYRITYGYLGVAPCTLEILGKKSNVWYPLHTFHYNDSPGTSIQIPYLPIKLMAKNSGNSKKISVSSGSLNAAVLSEDTAKSTRYFQEDIFTAIPDETETTLINFRNKETFNGIINHIKAELVSTNSIIDTADICKISVIKNATISGATWIDEDINNSVIEYDNTGTYTGGNNIYTKFINGQAGTGSNSSPASQTSLLSELGLNLKPGEIATVVIERLTGTGGYNLGLAMNWRELF